MNPWIIVSWIGAACVAILIIALTISVVASLIRNAVPKKQYPQIFTGK